MHTRRTAARVHGAHTEDPNFGGMYRDVSHMYMGMYTMYMHRLRVMYIYVYIPAALSSISRCPIAKIERLRLN